VRVRVVAVTAQAFAQQIEMCLEAGMDSHVSKPFKQTVLLAATREHPVQTAGWPPQRRWLFQPLKLFQPLTPPKPELPVFDRVVFEDITDLLPVVELEEHLQTLITRCTTMLGGLQGLQSPGMRARACEL